MLQNGLQHTPRPQPTLRHSKEYLFSPSEHSPLQVPCEDIVMELNVPTKPRVSVETAVQTESVARDPNFIHEWRDKYLVAGLHSSTPKHPWSTIQEQVSFNNLDLSHISSEEQEEKSSSPHTSDTAISEIDDSAIVQARQVLRQLEVSEMNIGKAQQVLKDIQKIEDNSCVTSKGVHVQDANLEDTRRRSKNKSNINQDSSVEILRESGLRHSHGSISATSRSWSALSVIEGDDILEEAKRVLKELDVTRRSSKFKSRLNVSRNLMDSFEKAALEDSKEVNEPKRITRNVVPKNVQEDKRFAPVTLSCLVSNELDFLEDCNDTLLKMSEVSRAQCYAFAKETNLANQFLKKDQYKSPPRGDEPVEPCSAVPTVNDTLVDELRRSLQEAFDQIEQQSREMSLLKKDMSTSKGESPSKATELLRSPLPTAQFTKTPARSRTLASAALPSEDALLIESGAQEEGSMTSGSAQTASEAKSVTYTNEESSRSASSQMTISVAELKGRDDGSSADYKRLSTLPLQKLRKTSAHEKGDQDSESVSQDTRSRSSDTEKSAKSSVSVSTVKTLNSKLETQDIPVRTKSKSFSPEKGTVDGRESPSLSTLSKRTDSLTSTISTEKVIHDQQRERENENSDIEQETKDMKHQIVADKGQTAKVVLAGVLERMLAFIKSIINYIFL
ncbi:microtubule-associated protein futsch-like [Varroa jacobsoni]|uniref:microtubule-associated protein futsch-like n=1 Tax=Varroa jacobsoni TaxID=62625 RepID=UPI000BF8284C|nr:microtubule-associated protein futsch-like [Varroa jacobsoni]